MKPEFLVKANMILGYIGLSTVVSGKQHKVVALKGRLTVIAGVVRYIPEIRECKVFRVGIEVHQVDLSIGLRCNYSEEKREKEKQAVLHDL